jgi:aminoglycoside 2''-phosphotransferase
MNSTSPDWRQIESEAGDLSVRSARFLGEGWNSSVYVVNDELVFRFPKRAEHWDELNREIAFLAFAADRLPLEVPRYVQVRPESPSAPHGYAVYRYLPGEPLDIQALTGAERDAAAERIAAFLRALHVLRPEPPLAALLPRDDARTVALDYCARTERELLTDLSPTERQSLRTLFNTYLATPENFTFRPVVLHADLSRDHLVMRDKAVIGVLDFGDVNFGDADYDFMYVYVDFGPPFASDVAWRYGHARLDALRAKLRYYAAVDQIGTMLDGRAHALAGQADLARQRLKQLLQGNGLEI